MPVPLLRRVRGPATAAGQRWWRALGRRGAEEEVPQTGYGFDCVLSDVLVFLILCGVPLEFDA